MPIYEYNCRSCSHHFETIILSRTERIACPKCDSETLEKQLSVFAAPASSAEECPAPSSGCMGNPTACGCH